MQAQAEDLITDEDSMRADLYGFLANFLLHPPNGDLILKAASIDGDESQLGQAFRVLASVAADCDAAQARDEYNALFIGLGRGELLPYASYYLTGFLNEKPLAGLRRSMRHYGIEKQASVSEPEDHIGSLFEMMAGLIQGRYGGPVPLNDQRKFFDTHIEPWAGHFFQDLEKADNSRLYQPIGTIGRLFVSIEKHAFELV